MHKEVSHAIELGATLVAIGLVLLIVITTQGIGQGVGAQAADEMSRVASSVEDSVLQDMVGQRNVIPTATAYSIFLTYGTLIPTCDCYVCNKTTDLQVSSPCVYTHLKGKVSLEVVRESDSWYNITVHKPDCTWYFGTCNCH